MWKPLSAFDQWPKVGLPSHSAPQPVLEASVVTTFLVWTNPMATPFFIHCGFFQGVRAVTQAWFTLICKRPWRHALCGTRGFNQRWRGRMRSRPSCNTGDAAAIRPSILWNTLSGRAVSLLKVAASFWMARGKLLSFWECLCFIFSSGWAWTPSRLLSRRSPGATLSSCWAGALGQEVSHSLWPLLCFCEALSGSFHRRSKEAAGGNWSIKEGDPVRILDLHQRKPQVALEHYQAGHRPSYGLSGSLGGS